MTQNEERSLLDEREVRIEKAKNMEQEGIQPYPSVLIENRISTREALAKSHEAEVTVVGRIMGMRLMGKIVFFDLQDQEGKIQCVYRAPENDEAIFERFTKYVDRGDIIRIDGTRFVTKKGEESVLAHTWTVLAKTLQPLPDKHKGLKDQNIRFRKRYLDLIADREVFDRFKTRSKILTLVRQFLNERGFMEVETPTLQRLYGGTNARPFQTHINAYDMDMYLRISPELYLKRLVVGGYEKVYEIGKNFRNEGVDQTHNPEFTMIEWYETCTNYHAMMDQAEALYKYIAQSLFGEEAVTFQGTRIPLDHAWERIPMEDVVKTHTGMDVMQEDEKALKDFCEKNHLDCPEDASRGKILYTIFDEIVSKKLTGPLWVIDYPQEISPLARTHRSKPGFVERFECYFNGKELGDGWTEITSPFMQRDRFENEQRSMRAGNEDSHPLDEDFLEALEYGMPPLGGIGIGIDRLVMFFTGTTSIREVLFFPFMRPDEGNEEKE